MQRLKGMMNKATNSFSSSSYYTTCAPAQPFVGPTSTYTSSPSAYNYTADPRGVVTGVGYTTADDPRVVQHFQQYHTGQQGYMYQQPHYHYDYHHKRPDTMRDVALLFLAIFLPPLAVWMKRGRGTDLWINIALTILGWLPGIIHAFYIIIAHPDEFYFGTRRKRRHQRAMTYQPVYTYPVCPPNTAPVYQTMGVQQQPVVASSGWTGQSVKAVNPGAYITRTYTESPLGTNTAATAPLSTAPLTSAAA
jgi:uncharacterized membrane protein YqaE (UPF0057 family)